MKVHFRDRITAFFGIALLAVLAGTSYYYSLVSEYETFKHTVNKNSPDFVTNNIVITEFDPEGRAYRRFFADKAEHFSDGRMSSVNPRMVTLYADEPQTKASADSGTSSDDGKTVVLTGNVLVTRSGELDRAPIRFTTTHLTVYPDTGRMQTDAPVELQNGVNVVTGTGLTLDNVDRTVHIHSNVRTYYMPHPDSGR